MNRMIWTFGGVLSASSLLLMDSAIKGTVLLALAAVAALMLRRDSAATRHLVWMMAIVALLIVPVLSATLPQWRVLPNWMSSSRPSFTAIESSSDPTVAKTNGAVIEMPQRAPSVLPVVPAEVDPSAMPDLPPAAPTQVSQPTMIAPREIPAQEVGIWSWINAIPLVWALGFVFLMLRLSAARWMLWSSERLAVVVGQQQDSQIAAVKRKKQKASQDPLFIAMMTLCGQLNIRRPITLLIHPHKTIPVVWGIFRCRLMLPVAARQWSEEQLQSVLMHELAHIKRGDILVQLLTQVACALHWFNPLVWFAAWRLDVERERSCDDLVLASGIRPSAYAAHLLDVVSGLTSARWTQACGLAMARKSSLEGRLTAVLGKDRNRRSVSVTLAVVAMLIAVGIAVPIAMVRAADEKWNPPQAVHISSNDFSVFCVHDGKEVAYITAYHGRSGSSTSGSSNAKLRTWNDNSTLTLLDTAEKRKFTLGRDHTAPNKLTLDGKDYDLAKGRVFLLADNGSIRQLDIATPPVTARDDADGFAKLIAKITPRPMKNRTGKLQPQTVAKLKWGEPVNGLRMALAFPPALKDPLLGDEEFYQLVVQNVSEKAVHYAAGDQVLNPRSMIYREGERIVQVLSDEDVQRADWNLAPGECGVLWLFTKEERNKEGKTISSLLDSDLPSDLRYHVVVSMEIAQAADGAWTGKLVTGEMRSSEAVAAPPTPMPHHKDARALYDIWQRYARANGDIPGGLIGELAAAVKQFIKYNPTWQTVPKLNEVLPRLDATRDWKPADAVAVLDEVASVQATLLEPAPWKGTRQTIRQGEALPKKYADASWGEEQPNGLRAAWLLEPNATEYHIGAALKARLLVQNRGQVPVMLQVPTWHQGQVKAADAKGTEVQVSGIEWTTMALLHTVHLGPGEYIEINTPGVGIGPRAGMGPWAGPRVGSNVLAKPGDELTLTYSLVPLDGSEVGISEEDPHVSGPLWWLAHIKARLNRELPLPADPAERTRMLDRAVRELFVTAPTAEETAAFIADKTPDAIDALAKRLAARTDAVSFSGKLPTAPVKFRVLDAVANADKQPRVVFGPGEYPLPCTTADRGNSTLKIVGKPVGDRRTNEAQILFEATEAIGKLPPDPYKLVVPDGWGTWAIVCRPSDGYFYLLHNGTVRKIDYSKPRNVTDIPANDLPIEFRDEVKRQLDIHEISAAQQAEIFEKPAAPAAATDSRTSANVPAKPSEAGTPKLPKLPDEDYTKTGVQWQKYHEEDAKGPGGELMSDIVWTPSRGDCPLEIGLRVAKDAKWNIGGQVRVEMVVRNLSGSDVKFSQSGRADNGLSVVAFDKDCKELVGEIAQFDAELGFNHLLLPRSHAVKVKSFMLRFDPDKRDVSEPQVAAFHLAPGDYTLRCKWNDAHPEVAHEGEWTGELVCDEHKFTLAAADATQPTSEAPKTTEQEPFTAWGKEVNGLQAGLGFKVGEKRAYHHGETANVVLQVRNVGKEAVEFKHIWAYFVENPPVITDASGKQVHLPRLEAEGQHGPRSAKIASGKTVELYEWRLELQPEKPRLGRNLRASTLYGTGKFSLHCERIVGPTSANPNDPNPAMSNLATGKLELEILPVVPVQQETSKPKRGTMLLPATEKKLKWGEPVNGLRAALVMAPVPDEPDAEDKNDIFLVVQNVTKTEVWLHASDAAPNPRQLIWRDKDVLETVNEVAKPIPADFQLQPGEVAFFRMTHPPGKRNPGGRSTGSLIEESIRKDPEFSLEGSMGISNAPDGAWSGKLVTGRTEGGTAIPGL